MKRGFSLIPNEIITNVKAYEPFDVRMYGWLQNQAFFQHTPKRQVMLSCGSAATQLGVDYGVVTSSLGRLQRGGFLSDETMTKDNGYTKSVYQFLEPEGTPTRIEPGRSCFRSLHIEEDDNIQ